ncbi:nuclear transport factor 2 family protein [Nocardioides sp. LHG3406-4]|uniref:nuclear transport factor 2 family protein n=1 Tax=Nocardioides sp. LHG3406-4 TaxID=2804575 RepID=UPI003CEB21DA
MTQTTGSTSLDTVREYHRAWTGGDIDQAMTLVADDVVCHAPGGDLVGKAAYRGFLAGFAPKLIGLSDAVSFADDDRVALFYYPHTAVTTTAPAAEYFTLREGVITESVLVFDRLSFAPPQHQ